MDELELSEFFASYWWVIVVVIVVLAVLYFLIFLLERKFRCWYWKVDERIQTLEKTNDLLAENLMQIRQSNVQLHYISEVLYSMATNRTVNDARDTDPAAVEVAPEAEVIPELHEDATPLPTQEKIPELYADATPKPEPAIASEITPAVVLPKVTIGNTVATVVENEQVENKGDVIDINVDNDSEEE
ncbi:MAG: hypothetical protein J5750_00985 [Clostridiales bacterium]|nr:hypothetical protein [Clostridiales bacterium]